MRILATVPVWLVRSVTPCAWLHYDHLWPHFCSGSFCCGCGCCKCCCLCCCCWCWTGWHHLWSALLVEWRPEVPWGPPKAEAIDGWMDDGIIQRQTRVPWRRTIIRRTWHIMKWTSGGPSSKTILVLTQPPISWEIIVEIVPPIIRSRGQSRRRAINVTQTVLIENIGKDSVFLGRLLLRIL